MDVEQKYKAFNKVVKNHNNFVLIGHVNTDGDAIGSLLALYFSLTDRGKEASLIIPGSIPEKYKFLNTDLYINQYPGSETKRRILEAQVIIILDISALGRLDCWYDSVVESSAIKMCIDHHPLDPQWLNLAIVDTEKVATGEMVYDYLKVNDIQITPSIAEALYTAIISDSGNFRFQKTNRSTFLMAADLLDYGIEPSEMYSRIFETKKKHQIRAWGELLANLESDGKLLWVTVEKVFLKRHNIRLEEIDGLIDIMRKENQASVYMVFVEKNHDEILVGLRSKNGVNVGEIAKSLGGGGHYNAAGFTANHPLEEVVAHTIKQFHNFN